MDYDDINENWHQWKFSVDIKLFLQAPLQNNDDGNQEELKNTWNLPFCYPPLQDDDDDNQKEGKYTLNLPFGHVAVLLKDDQLLKTLLRSKPDYKYWIYQIVTVYDSENNTNFEGQDAWLLKANCLHFASRFYPESLHVFLSFFDERGTKKKLIDETHAPLKFSPLHCAATQPESIGTR